MFTRTLPMLCLASALALALSACSKTDDAAPGEPTAAGAEAAPASDSGSDTAATPAAAYTAPNIAEGPDVCFKAVAAHLGADAKVSEIDAFFSAGSEIDANDSGPKGTLTTCSVKYQNPEDPRKLLSNRMDTRTGTFGTPDQLEITVTGNAADFDLEDYLIPLSQIDAAALAGVMRSQDPALAEAFSVYAWDDVRLSAPGPFSDVHTLRIGVEGRLAKNDIKQNGYASVSVDGKQITTNHLIPR